MKKKKSDKLGKLAELLIETLIASSHRLAYLIMESLDSLIAVMLLVIGLTLVFFNACLAISALTGWQNFLFFVGPAVYLPILILILRSEHALKAEGLLVGWDVVTDTLEEERGLRVVPIGDKYTVELSYPKVMTLRSVVFMGRVIFFIALQCLIGLAVFGFIPIWEHPSLLGPLFLVGLIWILLETPWARNNPVFGQMRPLAMAAWLITVGVLVVGHLFRIAGSYTNAAIWQAEQLEGVRRIPWIAIFTVALLLYAAVNFPTKEDKK